MTSAVFVPFLGDFLSMALDRLYIAVGEASFRPLSWGLSFNMKMVLPTTRRR